MTGSERRETDGNAWERVLESLCRLQRILPKLYWWAEQPRLAEKTLALCERPLYGAPLFRRVIAAARKSRG